MRNLWYDVMRWDLTLLFRSGYLAAGGQRSELVVRELHGNWAFTTTTGGSINNGLCIAETNGEKRLMVCNNDETIKIFSLPSMHLIDNLCLPTAVNGGKILTIICLFVYNTPRRFIFCLYLLFRYSHC
jgi:hypothetical protein